jgi:glyoxylase-like metal-dependent hydrolase (beta-lactamase superfamily II)
MLKKCLLVLLLISIVSVPVQAQDAKAVIAAASKAMGADNVKSIQYSGPGSEFSFGQAYNPASAWPEFKNKSYTRTIDFETPALRIDRVQEPIDPQRKGGGLTPGATQTIIVNANTGWTQQLEIWKTPYGFLRAATANNATVKSQTVGGKKYNVVTFMGQNKAKVNGYINEQNMLERVETWIDNAVTGDTLLDISYTGYKDFAGAKFPTKIVEKQGGYPTLDLTVTDVKPNIAANIQSPQGRGGAPGGGGGGAPAQPAASSQKLADGVYLILPGYAALAVDFKDYIVVIEGPQSEARGTAIIAEAKKVIPNKPIKYVVNTHIHFDHSSGLRAFVAEGSTILTHQINKGYWEKLLAAPHTLNPDRQETAKKKVSVETFGDKKVLTDGNHVIELHRLQGGLHQEGMVVAYLPKEKILVEADAFNPPAQPNAPVATPINPATLNLVDNIDRLKLDVETIIPVHYPADGRKVTKAELLRAAGKAQSN